MRAGEGRIPAGDLRKQAGVSCSAHRSLDVIPGVGRGLSRSGFRPTGVVEGATGLPVGLHIKGQTQNAIFATVAFGLRLLWN